MVYTPAAESPTDRPVALLITAAPLSTVSTAGELVVEPLLFDATRT